MVAVWTRFRSLALLVIASTVALAIVALPGTAFARGTLKLENSRPKEKDERWRLKLVINYGSKPHLTYVPMIFEFVPTVYYERTLTDASPDKPINRRVPLHNQTPNNVRMDVGFSCGRDICARTKFSFKISRSDDFQAGEYKLTVRLASGGTIGRSTKVVLQGDNPVINRKAMIFHTDKPVKKKKVEMEKVDPNKRVAAEDMGPNLDDIPDDPTGDDAVDEPPGPPPVDPKSTGCAITTPPKRSGAWFAWLLVGLTGLLALRARS